LRENELPKIEKEFYEGKPLLKPRNKKNPTGVKTEGEIDTIQAVELIKLPKTGNTYMEKFKEHEESLALNKTNVKSQVDLFGDNTDAWIGQQVKLIVILANNPQTGRETPTIRVKPKDWEYGDDEES
jgi:hypothetical protein